MYWLATVGLAAFLLPAGHLSAIQNEKVRVALDEGARPVELTNRATGWNYAGSARVWRMFYRDREIRDDTDIQRRVNLNLIRGLRNDVELYRCRATVAVAPHYQQYLAKVNALREKYAEFFLEGLYRDTDFFTVDSSEVAPRCFQSADRILVVATQSRRPEVQARLKVAGYRLVKTDGLGPYRAEGAGDGLTVTLGQHAVALGVFQKQQQAMGTTAPGRVDPAHRLP